jgi:tetratricopeptide (TPR) repeat protein
LRPAANEPMASDYQTEVGLLRRNVRLALHDYVANPSTRGAFEVAYQYFTLASLTGDFNDFSEAEFFLKAARRPDAEYLFSFGYFDYKLHRFQAAEAKLKEAARYARDPHVRGHIHFLLADLCFQSGRTGCDQPAATTKAEKLSWQERAREANRAFQLGEFNRAVRLYAEAQVALGDDQGKNLSQKRNRAWLELQRGIMELQYQRYPEALACFQRADSAYSGYWLIEEHIAETLGLLGRKSEARALYRKVVTETQNPEYYSALAELVDSPAEREALWREGTRRFNERMALFPEAASNHYVDFLLRRKGSEPAALDLARADFQRRPNPQIKFALAKAYSANAQCGPALGLVQEILAGGQLKIPELYSIAETAASDCGESSLAAKFHAEKKELLAKAGAARE